ncbi:MAG: hypothetical protein ACP5E4_00635 [Candidatus Aenigmatarchaeota archaeon]
MAEEVKIIKFRVAGDPHGKAHTGLQPKGKRTARSLCRGVEMEVAEVVLDCGEWDECTICRMKRQNLVQEFGSLRDWAEREGYVVMDDLTGK